MEVFQVKLKIYLLQNIGVDDVQAKICAFIDSALAKNEKLLEFHNCRDYKNYCFDSFYPLEEDKIYKEDKVYTVTIRTISKKLEQFFSKVLVNEYNYYMKALSCKSMFLPKKQIEKIYSLSPVIMKNDSGYWKGKIPLEEYERRLKENLIKKYNTVADEKVDEDFQFYTSIEFKNQKPISTPYKNIKLLGDKISLMIADNETAQKLAYMSLGTGILENNSRGFGYLNYHWV